MLSGSRRARDPVAEPTSLSTLPVLLRQWRGPGLTRARLMRVTLDLPARPCSLCVESQRCSLSPQESSTSMRKSDRLLRQIRDSESRGRGIRRVAPRALDSGESLRRGWRWLPPAPSRQSLETCECESLRACADNPEAAAGSDEGQIQAAPGPRALACRAPPPAPSAALRAR